MPETNFTSGTGGTSMNVSATSVAFQGDFTAAIVFVYQIMLLLKSWFQCYSYMLINHLKKQDLLRNRYCSASLSLMVITLRCHEVVFLRFACHSID